MVEFNGKILSAVFLVLFLNNVLSASLGSYCDISKQNIDFEQDLVESSQTGIQTNITQANTAIQNLINSLTGITIANCLPEWAKPFYILFINFLNLLAVLELIGFVRELIGFT